MPRPDFRRISNDAVARIDTHPEEPWQEDVDILDMLEWVAVQQRALENIIRRNNGFLDKALLDKALERAEREIKMENEVFNGAEDGNSTLQ